MSRRFFSGRSLQAAVLTAAAKFNLEPDELAYEEIDKRHGLLKSRDKVVIAVDPEQPRKSASKRVAAPPETAAPDRREAPRRREPTVEAEEPRAESAPAERGAGAAAGSEEARAARPAAPRRRRRPEPDAEPEVEAAAATEPEVEAAAAAEPEEPAAAEVIEEEPERARRRPRGRREEPSAAVEEAPRAAREARPDREVAAARVSEERSRRPREAEDSVRVEAPRRTREAERAPREEAPRRERDEREVRGDRGERAAREDRAPRPERERRGEGREERAPPGDDRGPRGGERGEREGLVELPDRPRALADRYPRARGPLAKAAQQAVEAISAVAGLEVKAEVFEGDDRLEIDISGPHHGLLVAEDGELLVAIEHLLPRVMRGYGGETAAVRVDCENFQEIREERLRSFAQVVAGEVRRTGRARNLDPLSPSDRRIVHLTVADEPGVESESDGNGYLKRVRISPA